ncbi:MULTISPECIES: type II secretion system protein GspL [Burkholderia]|uniref:Type II secretion system protein GspL n=19 Tax=Burkholderiaceae TaxID=119060 RepID=A0A250L7I0_9BURK|nr:type II secretion system protein GspL [Burkholderia contaminans]UTP22076.1 type II secretion system protein GspL [Burkholderia sp. FXe9]KKL29965.1 general secretion pathway protein GspL [Burkholderia contaminans LMG 23361]MBA9830458.1 type II secretion system protein GspL [Burkholderia contaminans]MBA9838781.1 type II secretion system protein GspL [Burkholderia contaminans]MBA9863850.1 type II secretion system protein GspL [Burkholderia contaminans]
MSTLIVSLPPREPAVPLQEWQWPELPFTLVDKAGHVQRAGRAALALLPRANATVLIVAARDVLLLAATVPPLKGPKLRQALPNIVEDQLIQDPLGCHIALDPDPLPDGRRVLAVVDRAWFRTICEAFTAAGHRHLSAVPATRCLPAPRVTAAPADSEVDAAAVAADAVEAPPARPATVAAVLGLAASVEPVLVEAGALPAAAGAPRLELAVARGALGEGFAAPASRAAGTLAALAGGGDVELYELGDPGAEPRLASVGRTDGGPLLPGAAPLSFDAFARRALTEKFDLCQFEFESQPWRFDRATVKRLRVPLALVAATLGVAVIGMNLHWWKLSRERDALSAQITETLLSAFPKTTTVLDPPAQMQRQLDQLRLAAGELSPNDFLALASGLSRSMGALPLNGIASLDYHDRRLDVGFKPEVKVDPDFTQRLARNGLSGEVDSNTGKWTIRSRS